MNLGAQPRFRLATLPTPFQEAPRLRQVLGGPNRCPRIYIKRDDLTGLAFGGNKVRKLEFLIADALLQESTVVITAGAAQSNHARATAAAANVAGLRSALVLSAETDHPEEQGNLLLDRLLGAEVHFVDRSADKDAAMEAIAAELRRQGERPYVIPVGGSNAIGMLGYVAATLELLGQCVELGIAPTKLFYAAGSYGTQAGLTVGAKMFGATYQLVAIADSAEDDARRLRAIASAREATALCGHDLDFEHSEFTSDPNYFGAGYGAMTASGIEAIRLLAQTEAILLDPVYTGKAMAGLIDYVRTSRISPDETVIFLHTGGGPGLFARGAELTADS